LALEWALLSYTSFLVLRLAAVIVGCVYSQLFFSLEQGWWKKARRYGGAMLKRSGVLGDRST